MSLWLVAGTAAAETISTGSLVFGSSGQFVCTLSNTGDSTLDLNTPLLLIDADGDTIQTTGNPAIKCGATLAPGASCIDEAAAADSVSPTGLQGLARCEVDIDGSASQARVVLELRLGDGNFLVTDGRVDSPVAPIPATLGIATGLITAGLLLGSGVRRHRKQS